MNCFQHIPWRHNSYSTLGFMHADVFQLCGTIFTIPLCITLKKMFRNIKKKENWAIFNLLEKKLTVCNVGTIFTWIIIFSTLEIIPIPSVTTYPFPITILKFGGNYNLLHIYNFEIIFFPKLWFYRVSHLRISFERCLKSQKTNM